MFQSLPNVDIDSGSDKGPGFSDHEDISSDDEVCPEITNGEDLYAFFRN